MLVLRKRILIACSGYAHEGLLLFEVDGPMSALLRLARVTVAATLTCMTTSASAVTPELPALRSQFSQAYALFNQGKWQQAVAMSKGLELYPLYPYLAYEQLRKQITPQSGSDIQAFISRYPDFPFNDQLQSQWANQLAKTQQWSQYLQVFPSLKADASQRCWQAWALYQSKQDKLADQATTELWLNGQSQPQACEAPFATWKKRGLQSTQMIQARLGAALAKDNLSLANYLVDLLPKGEQASAKQLINLYRKPTNLAQALKSWKNKDSWQAKVYVHLLEKQAKEDASAVLSLYHPLAKSLQPNQAERSQTQEYLLSRLARQQPEQTLAWSKKLGQPLSEDVGEILLRAALAQPNWQTVLQLHAAVDKEVQEQERWRYWYSRASLALNKNQQQAKQMLQKLAQERSFYGYYAAQQLQSRYQLNHQPLPISGEQQRSVLFIPAVTRAMEWSLLGEDTNSRREWYRALDNMSQEQKVAAARLAMQWGWHFVSIYTMAKAKHWDDTQLRFPLAYREVFLPAAQSLRLDADWVIAISRQESAFRHDATSHAGARGLMQLMPRTAQHTAKRYSLANPNPQDLLIPQVNIRLGTHYLDELRTTFNGNRILATAAYNAGPSRVKRWLAERGHLDADAWIETIPFNETRQYVQNVLTYAVIYQAHLQRPQLFIKQHEFNLAQRTP